MNFQYPIGHFSKQEDYSIEDIKSGIQVINQLPSLIKIEINPLKEDDFYKTYRPGGWTITQLIHHIADSHMNAFIRTKLALTENTPTIKPYQEASWAIQADYDFHLIESSLQIIEAVHSRWSSLLQSLSIDDWKKEYYHPEMKEKFNVKQIIMLYKWHGLHHLEHIKIAKKSLITERTNSA